MNEGFAARKPTTADLNCAIWIILSDFRWLWWLSYMYIWSIICRLETAPRRRRGCREAVVAWWSPCRADSRWQEARWQGRCSPSMRQRWPSSLPCRGIHIPPQGPRWQRIAPATSSWFSTVPRQCRSRGFRTGTESPTALHPPDRSPSARQRHLHWTAWTWCRCCRSSSTPRSAPAAIACSTYCYSVKRVMSDSIPRGLPSMMFFFVIRYWMDSRIQTKIPILRFQLADGLTGKHDGWSQISLPR